MSAGAGAGVDRDRFAGVPRGILRLASRVADRVEAPEMPVLPPPRFWPALPPRILAFLAIVLAHGFRRLLPPWPGDRGTDGHGARPGSA